MYYLIILRLDAIIVQMNKLGGSLTLRGSIDNLWSFLTDSKKLSSCIPDLKKIDIKDDKHFKLEIKPSVAFVTGTFEVDVRLENLKKPTSAGLNALLKGVGGTAEVKSTFKLKKIDAKNTELKWEAEFNTTGVLATLPSSLIEGFSKKIVDGFFECVSKTL